ncbi:MAG: cytochrome c oxidase subunit I [Candidatus Acidiferrales bacterium]
MATATIEQRLEELWETPKTLYGKLSTVDHKEIGWRYIVTAMVFLVLGGVEALIMRLQLAGPNGHLLGPETYNQFYTMHGTTMIYWYAFPILAGFGNYLVPLMIGARDMAMPRLNAFSYWTFLFSGLFLYASLLLDNAPHAGWFAFAPYTLTQYSPGLGMDFFALALVLLTVSTTAGAINFLVTIFQLRAPGMTISKMPLFMYSSLTTYFSVVFSLPALTAALLFLELGRKWGFPFYNTALGGHALLWQQLFWFFAHPWVYIIFIPATGMISMMVPTFARYPIVGYPYIAMATILTGFVGFGVWLHHMFAVGAPHMSMTAFSAASMMISVFTAIQVFAWIATLWKGRPVMTTAFLFVLGFIALLVIGGLNGVVTAVIPVDWQLTQTYWLPAHIHYVIIGGNLFPVFAAFYFWMPKITGRMMNETAGKCSFWLMFIGMNVAFFPMQLLGIIGMPRRIYTYLPHLGFSGMNLTATIGAFILGFGIAISIVNFFASSRTGAIAGNNPWNADGLEWSIASPPKPYGFVRIPTVVSRHPLWDDHDEYYDPNDERVFDQDRFTLSTTWRDAEPVSLARMPEDTVTPLLLALTISLALVGILLTNLWIALAGVILSFAAEIAWLWPKHPPKVMVEPQNERVPA